MNPWNSYWALATVRKWETTLDKEKIFDPGVNWTHDLQIWYSVTLLTELWGQTHNNTILLQSKFSCLSFQTENICPACCGSVIFILMSTWSTPLWLVTVECQTTDWEVMCLKVGIGWTDTQGFDIVKRKLQPEYSRGGGSCTPQFFLSGGSGCLQARKLLLRFHWMVAL